MHCVFFHQPISDLSRPCSPVSSEHRSRYLHRATELDPLQDALRAALQNRVSFRMRDDGNRSGLSHRSEPFVHLGWNAEIAELHQQIARVADAKTLWFV